MIRIRRAKRCLRLQGSTAPRQTSYLACLATRAKMSLTLYIRLLWYWIAWCSSGWLEASAVWWCLDATCLCFPQSHCKLQWVWSLIRKSSSPLCLSQYSISQVFGAALLERVSCGLWITLGCSEWIRFSLPCTHIVLYGRLAACCYFRRDSSVMLRDPCVCTRPKTWCESGLWQWFTQTGASLVCILKSS